MVFAPVMAAMSAEKVEGSCGMASLARRSTFSAASSSSESMGTCRSHSNTMHQQP